MVLLAIGRAAVAQDLVTVSGAVTTRADGRPVSGAVVSVVGAHASAATDASGRYTLQVPHSRVRGADATVNSFNGIQTFPRQSPFGMNGRGIYVRIGGKF